MGYRCATFAFGICRFRALPWKFALQIPWDIAPLGEGQDFEHCNFRMADISNLKINERANVERPNLRQSLQYKMKFISKGNMKIGEIVNDAEYRMDKQVQNLLVFGILIIFQIKKII